MRITAGLVAAIAIATGFRLVGAQFVSPTTAPPTGSPTVIYSIAPAATAQTANINISGAVKAAGCVGATYVAFSAVVPNGDRGATGYRGADALCNAASAGSHVCRVEEVLESIRCGVTLPGASGWINGGPPGYTAEAKDCNGWKSSQATDYGRVWTFNNTSGGAGSMTSCSTGVLPYACCK